MAQEVVGDHAGDHRLADRHRADADARVVAALGRDLGLVAVAIHGLARREDRRGRLDGETRDDRLAGRDAAEDPARLVGQEARAAVVAHAHLVGVLLAGQRRGRKARAELHALDGVDAHERRREIAVELAIDRCAEAGRHAVGHDLDDGADRGAGLAHAVEILGEERHPLGVRTEERIPVDLVPIPAAAVDRMRPHLHERRAHAEAGHDLARDRAGRHARRGLTRRLASAAAVVAQAVFDIVSVVGMARPILVLDVRIVLRALVDILDHERDRRAGRDLRAARLVDEHAGEDLHRVGFLPLRGVARLAGPPLVEIRLDVGLAERNARRRSIDHAADRRPMALAEGRDAKEMAERVVGHEVSPRRSGLPDLRI